MLYKILVTVVILEDSEEAIQVDSAQEVILAVVSEVNLVVGSEVTLAVASEVTLAVDLEATLVDLVLDTLEVEDLVVDRDTMMVKKNC